MPRPVPAEFGRPARSKCHTPTPCWEFRLANGSSAASLAWRCSHEPSDDGRRFRPTVLPNLVLGQGTKSAAYAPLRKTDWFEAPSSHVPITPRGPSRLAPTNLPVCALRPDHRVEARNEFR